MKPVFYADTCYFIALLMKKDALHLKAKAAAKEIIGYEIVTSDFVLIEFLNSTSERHIRSKGIAFYYYIYKNYTVIPVKKEDFDSAFNIYYTKRPDKEYSIVDCISMYLARKNDINDILTADKHFTQEGFNALLK